MEREFVNAGMSRIQPCLLIGAMYIHLVGYAICRCLQANELFLQDYKKKIDRKTEWIYKEISTDLLTNDPVKILPPFVLPFELGNTKFLGDLAELIADQVSFGAEFVNLLVGVRRKVHLISRTGRIIL
jgi:hypothetical protein